MGSCTKWFAPCLWPLILVAMKQHGNITSFSLFVNILLKTRLLVCPYERIIRELLYEWFTPLGNWKKIYSCYWETIGTFIN